MTSFDNRKILFVHNGPLYTDKEDNYYSISFSDELKNRFLYLGSNVTFLMRKKKLPECNKTGLQKISPENFSFIELPQLMSFYTRILNSRSANNIVKKAVFEHNIVVARLPSKAGSIAVKYCKKFNKPYIIELVSCVWDAYWYYHWRGKLIAPYFFLKQRFMVRNVPFIIYVTKKFLQSRYPSNASQINISNVELKPASIDILNKRLLKIESLNDKAILTLGTIAALDVPYKGQADVIKAVSILKMQNVLINYKLVGGGDKSRLQSLINLYNLNDQVEIVGPLPHGKIFSFLDEIDIYIQPSKQEGLPRSVIEAMSRGCPVLGAKTGGIPELIPNDRIFKKGDVKQICRHIIRISLRKNMCCDAKINFNTAIHFSIENLDSKRRYFYNQFLKYYGMI